MTARYRKEGRVVHYEHGQLIAIAESGEAFERGGSFVATSLEPPRWTDSAAAAEVNEVARAIEAMAGSPLRLERLLVSRGVARHELGSRAWIDETRRIHAALTYPHAVRMLVDRGDFDIGAIASIVNALRRYGGERKPPLRLRLAAPVTAPLLTALVSAPAPGGSLWQRGGGRDGKGLEVRAGKLAGPPWPNWFRPSYRVRPVRAPFDLELRADRARVEDDLPLAVAILAPVTSPTLRVLVEEGGASTYATTFPVAGIEAAGPPEVWFPYGAGAWGCEAVVRRM